MVCLFAKLLKLLIHRLGSPTCVVAARYGCSDILAIKMITVLWTYIILVKHTFFLSCICMDKNAKTAQTTLFLRLIIAMPLQLFNVKMDWSTGRLHPLAVLPVKTLTLKMNAIFLRLKDVCVL